MHTHLTGYSVLSIAWGKNDKEYDDLFVGQLRGELHALGYRPQNCSYMFPERECIGGYLGRLVLPKNRESLSDLVEGDKLQIVDEKGNKEKFFIITEKDNKSSHKKAMLF